MTCRAPETCAVLDFNLGFSSSSFFFFFIIYLILHGGSIILLQGSLLFGELTIVLPNSVILSYRAFGISNAIKF